MKTRSIKKDIAIIGMSGKFPKSENISEFWKNLYEGNELIHFYSDLELEKLGVNADLIKNDKYIKSGSFIDNPGSFDYSFFGYTKAEAEQMDPQIRLLHEQVWLSLEDSGYNPFSYSNKIGCFFSASDNLNWRAYTKLFEDINVNSFLRDQISNITSVSRLISYSLNLKGPSYFVDTACSGSLVAVHIACRSLLMKECSMALAGGVSINSSTGVGYIYEEGMISSRDGHCKAFDIDSSGTIGGEGVGVVVLKRLEDALNDKDHIYSVIRSSSVNNDGNRKIGYTAPSIIGQSECIRTAHQIAEVDPENISYIETHGTGTKLGDSVEIEALNKAFNYDSSYQCAIGSLKTNIGHLDAAAGIAGLIKTALSINNKIILPSLHFKKPNPEINFKSGPFVVNTELKQWLSDKPLLAGVSSLGIGGTNVHVVLEEPPVQQNNNESKTYQLLLYSAKTKSSIESYLHNFKVFLENNKNINLADLSYTLKTGRHNFKYRKFLISKDNIDTQTQLSKIIYQEPFQVRDKKGVVFMFSGQGSQYYKMGKEIYLKFPYFKSIIDNGFEILKNETGVDYADVIGYNDFEKEESNLINDTIYTQPLLFLLEYAYAKLLVKLGIEPSNMIGHSLGEYVAACISELFTFEDGLKLIVKRAYLMSKLEQGSMLSIDLSAEKVLEFIPADISVAAINTESSCVIAGNFKSVKTFSEILSSKGITFIELKTSHAFHSQMMDPILEAYEIELKKINFSQPKYLFVSSCTGLTIKKEEATSINYWVRHLRETVNFSKGIDSLIKEGHLAYVEIGSNRVLTNFLKQKINGDTDLVLTSVMSHPKEIADDSYCLLNTLGNLWSRGIDINWNEYYLSESRSRISAPTYSFDKVIFPSKVNPIEKIMELSAPYLNHNISGDYSEWIYEQGWKEVRNETSQIISFDWILCFLNDDDFSDKLKYELIKEYENVIFVKRGSNYFNDGSTITIDFTNPKDYEKLSNEVLKSSTGNGKIIHAWCAHNKIITVDDSSLIEHAGYFSLLNLARTFMKSKRYGSIYLDFLVNEIFNVNGNEKISSIKSLALAALKVIPKEYEDVHCRCVEFLLEDFDGNVSCRNNFFSKLKIVTKEQTISLRGNKTWKPFYEKIEVNRESLIENIIKVNGLYVITGSNGGVGKVIAEFLADDYNANLILIGRGEEDKSLISKLKKESNLVYYIQDDLSDVIRLKDKLDTLKVSLNKKFDGVFHTAGLGDYSGLINDRVKEDCQQIFLPKITGTNNLFELLKTEAPDFIVLCSSISSILAPFGQVAYVAANLYQNSFAYEHYSKTKVVSVLWDTWKEVGMAVKASKRNKTDASDLLSYGISNKDGINLIKYALNGNSPEIIVSVNDFNSQVLKSQEYSLKKAFELVDSVIVSTDIVVERPDLITIYETANTETEKILCELWKTIFGYEKIGVHDDFFELGGDSLKVMTLINRIHRSFNIEISIGDFFKKSNIVELAKEIDLAVEINTLNLNKSIAHSKKSNQIRL